jgi:hypothetical protein
MNMSQNFEMDKWVTVQNGVNAFPLTSKICTHKTERTQLLKVSESASPHGNI